MMELKEISVGKIKVGKYDLRMERKDEEIADLAASIKRIGIIEPLVVSEKSGKFFLIAGHRRFRAAKEARLKKVPCVIEGRKMAVQGEVAIAENFFRKDMSPIELGVMIVEYKQKMKLTFEQIGKILHKTERWVRGVVAMADWPTDVQVAVHKGQVTVSAAGNLAEIGDKTYRLFLLRNAIEQGATARTTAAWLQEYQSRQPMEKAVQAEPVGSKPTAAPAVPQVPCFFCATTFPIDRVSHVPVCAECVKEIKRVGG